MIEFFLSSENLPFAVSITLVIAIALMEGVGFLFGAGISNLLDSLFSDSEIDFDLPDEIESPSFFTRFLSWLRVGSVPIIVIFLSFFALFGIIGFVLQSAGKLILGFYLPWYLSVWPVLLLTFPLVRVTGKAVAKIIPEDETSAISDKSFIGHVATITLGKAKKGEPAEAKFTDQFSQTHYIMVEPDIEGEIFEQGEKVLIVSQISSVYKAIKNINTKLTD